MKAPCFYSSTLFYHQHTEDKLTNTHKWTKHSVLLPRVWEKKTNLFLFLFVVNLQGQFMKKWRGKKKAKKHELPLKTQQRQYSDSHEQTSSLPKRIGQVIFSKHTGEKHHDRRATIVQHQCSGAEFVCGSCDC